MFRGPPVQLICPADVTFPYVPGHLSHIIFELLKNSLRAVVERFGADYEDRAAKESSGYPPIKVIVVEGREDITIKISDEGGGIPRSAIPLIWTYMYTTMAGQSIDQDFHASDFQAPMAGFGYGLPLSRLVCYFYFRPRVPLANVIASSWVCLVCQILWWRSAPHLHGRVWDGCIHPFE